MLCFAPKSFSSLPLCPLSLSGVLTGVKALELMAFPSPPFYPFAPTTLPLILSTHVELREREREREREQSGKQRERGREREREREGEGQRDSCSLQFSSSCEKKQLGSPQSHTERRRRGSVPSSVAMNPCIPDWNFECDLPFANQKKSPCPNNELVELLWQNGQVVMQSQTHRRPQKPETHHHQNPVERSHGNSSTLIHEDETISWIHYPVDDPFEKEFCSPFFTELPSADHPLETAPVQANSKHSFGLETARELNQMLPPPRVQFSGSALQQSHGPTKFANFSKFGGAGDVRECSGVTVGSSHCGSNQVVRNETDLSRASSDRTGTIGLTSQLLAEDNILQMVPQKMDKFEPTVTSSSGGSGSSFGGTHKNSAGTSNLKRKGREFEDTECQSEAAELETDSGKKTSRQSGSTRRSRAAEVHNLSERRRRDRINKKMRALQELIPHCNKTDKASMLDEAIEYLKSLQLQLQVMWMGGGMGAPMMFPGMQPYMSPMGLGMGAHPLASVHSNLHLPRVPVVDHQSMSMAPVNQNMMCQAPALNPVNFQSQMQNQSLPEQLVRYMGIQQLQAAAASQPMNMFRFSPQTLQNPQMNAVPGTSMVQHGGGMPTNDASGSKMS